MKERRTRVWLWGALGQDNMPHLHTSSLLTKTHSKVLPAFTVGERSRSQTLPCTIREMVAQRGCSHTQGHTG